MVDCARQASVVVLELRRFSCGVDIDGVTISVMGSKTLRESTRHYRAPGYQDVMV